MSQEDGHTKSIVEIKEHWAIEQMYRADKGQLANGHLQSSRSILGGAHLGRSMKANYFI